MLDATQCQIAIWSGPVTAFISVFLAGGVQFFVRRFLDERAKIRDEKKYVSLICYAAVKEILLMDFLRSMSKTVGIIVKSYGKEDTSEKDLLSAIVEDLREADTDDLKRALHEKKLERASKTHNNGVFKLSEMANFPVRLIPFAIEVAEKGQSLNATIDLILVHLRQKSIRKLASKELDAWLEALKANERANNDLIREAVQMKIISDREIDQFKTIQQRAFKWAP